MCCATVVAIVCIVVVGFTSLWIFLEPTIFLLVLEIFARFLTVIHIVGDVIFLIYYKVIWVNRCQKPGNPKYDVYGDFGAII